MRASDSFRVWVFVDQRKLLVEYGLGLEVIVRIPEINIPPLLLFS